MTAKQQRFVEEYLIDLNATQAAVRAGYSPNTAQEIGSENLSKPIISAAIQRAIADRSRRTGMNADRIIDELAKIAFANVDDLIDLANGTVKPDGARDDTAAIQSVRAKTVPTKQGDITEHELRLYDKLKALELLGRHLGLFNDRLQLQGCLEVYFSGESELE